MMPSREYHGPMKKVRWGILGVARIATHEVYRQLSVESCPKLSASHPATAPKPSRRRAHWEYRKHTAPTRKMLADPGWPTIWDPVGTSIPVTNSAALSPANQSQMFLLWVGQAAIVRHGIRSTEMPLFASQASSTPPLEERRKCRLCSNGFRDYGLSSAAILDSVKSNSRSSRRSTSSFMRPSSRS